MWNVYNMSLYVQYLLHFHSSSVWGQIRMVQPTNHSFWRKKVFFFFLFHLYNFIFTLTLCLWFDLHRHLFLLVLFLLCGCDYNQEMEIQKSTCYHSKYVQFQPPSFTRHPHAVSKLGPRFPCMASVVQLFVSTNSWRYLWLFCQSELLNIFVLMGVISELLRSLNNVFLQRHVHCGVLHTLLQELNHCRRLKGERRMWLK